MTIRNLERMLAPRSIALIGASPKPGSVGLTVARNLLDAGFEGPLSFVNPRHAEVEGHACLPSLSAIAAPPDLAVLATPPDTIPDIIAELGRKGTQAAVVITAGIRGERKQAMLDAARPHCLRILGPNCIGLMLPPVGLNASFAHLSPHAGELAFLSQSGALVTAMIDWAKERGIGFSHVASLGDMADVDFGDLLDYLAGDSRSKAILIYMEALTSARKFMSAARRAARSKPVVVIKAGRQPAGAKAAQSHTGALAGSDIAYDAAFRRAGILRVDDLGELFQAAEMLSTLPRLDGERLTILTNGGGAGVLAADRLAQLGGRMAQLSRETMTRLDTVLPATWSKGNPVDIIGDAGPDRYGEALAALLADEPSDAILILNCPTALASSTDAARKVLDTMKEATPRQAKPILTAWLGNSASAGAREMFADARIPTFETPGAAVTGFMHVVRYTRAQAELMRTPPALPRSTGSDREAAARILAKVADDQRSMLTETEAKHVLACYGIATVETQVATDPESAGRQADALLAANDAVALKILSEDITHKSDVGGVKLDLRTAGEVVAAARAMRERIAAERPGAVLQGFTVQPMIRRPGAHELLIGVSEDETFGPTIMFGAGGTAVEVVRDTAQTLLPLDARLARDLIGETRIARLLAGYRDQPAADLDAIVDTLMKTSLLVAENHSIREIDINPLLADENGVMALDARIRISDPGEKERAPFAIRPYPGDWEKRVQAGNLGDVLLRPIRPEDEQSYAAFLRAVTPEDTRLRFFTPRIDLSHAYLSRFTQIDYARDMAFVAMTPDGSQMLGVSRLSADPDYTHAEYGVLVRSDLKGHGLGWQLMRHLISYARSEGLEALSGDVLAANATMLKMCAELGFDIRHDPDDPHLRKVRLDLAAGAEGSSDT